MQKIKLFTKETYKEVLTEKQTNYLSSKLDTLQSERTYFVIDEHWFDDRVKPNERFNILRYDNNRKVYTTFVNDKPRVFSLICAKNMENAYLALHNSVYFNKMNERARLPKREKGNAGYDVWTTAEFVTIEPHKTVLMPTGIKAYLPSDKYYLQVADRGSMGAIGITCTAGIVDNNYRGEIFVALCNTTDKTILFKDEYETVAQTEDTIYIPTSKAIAQLMMRKHYNLEVESIDDDIYELISNTNRGEDKLGSTDNNGKTV